MYFRQLSNEDVAGNLIVVQLSNDEGDSSDSIKLLLERPHLDTRLVELLRSTESGELRFPCPEVDESIDKHNNWTPFTLEGTLFLNSEKFTVSVPALYFKNYVVFQHCSNAALWLMQGWGGEKFGELFHLKPEYEHGYYLLELDRY
jgi:hypothetical protein